ncbi:MAG: hypothetical protein ACLR23_12075 [Clostridia bacterium]
MHAGEAGKGAGVQTEADCPPSTSRRPAAGKRDKNARRRGEEGQGLGVQTEAKCPPSTSRRPRRRGNRIKNARRRAVFQIYRGQDDPFPDSLLSLRVDDLGYSIADVVHCFTNRESLPIDGCELTVQLAVCRLLGSFPMFFQIATMPLSQTPIDFVFFGG